MHRSSCQTSSLAQPSCSGRSPAPPHCQHAAAGHSFGWRRLDRRAARGLLVLARGANSPFLKHTTWLSRGLADAPDSPFHELGLDEKLRNVRPRG